MTIKITPNDKGSPAGKLADVELHFGGIHDLRSWLSQYMDSCDDPNAFGPLMTALADLRALDGLRLLGFSIWERRTGPGRSVTFPARAYSVNGERRSYALLRAIDDTSAQEPIRDLILQAYADYEASAAPQAD